MREQCFVSTKESDDRPSRRCVFPFIYKGVLYQVHVHTAAAYRIKPRRKLIGDVVIKHVNTNQLA